MELCGPGSAAIHLGMPVSATDKGYLRTVASCCLKRNPCM